MYMKLFQNEAEVREAYLEYVPFFPNNTLDETLAALEYYQGELDNFNYIISKALKSDFLSYLKTLIIGKLGFIPLNYVNTCKANFNLAKDIIDMGNDFLDCQSELIGMITEDNYPEVGKLGAFCHTYSLEVFTTMNAIQKSILYNMEHGFIEDYDTSMFSDVSDSIDLWHGFYRDQVNVVQNGEKGKGLVKK